MPLLPFSRSKTRRTPKGRVVQSRRLRKVKERRRGFNRRLSPGLTTVFQHSDEVFGLQPVDPAEHGEVEQVE